MNIENLKNCLSFDLSYAKEYARNEYDFKQMTDEKEHYRLVAYMSYMYNDETLYDIGTYRGLSAIALAANPKNTVISYDIKDYLRVKQMSNIQYKIGNCYEDAGMLKSPLILLDVDPHNGEFEKQFVTFLLEKQYKGIVVFDDINLNAPMKEFWAWMTQVEKHDITEYGHHSGTGLAVFK